VNPSLQIRSKLSFYISLIARSGRQICLPLFILTFLMLSFSLFTVDAWAGESRSKKANQTKIGSNFSEEQLILLYTNKVRKRNGLRLLRLSRALRYMAQKHNRHMCSTKIFEHESDAFPKGWKTFGGRLKKVGLEEGGENIAYRSLGERRRIWAKEVVKGWMNSPPHRRNILNPRYRYLGVGFLGCSNRLGYATQVFSSQAGTIGQARAYKSRHRRSRRVTPLDKQSALR
jgi:uncharacterized protein YkwD